jgi:hypothetical protein
MKNTGKYLYTIFIYVLTAFITSQKFVLHTSITMLVASTHCQSFLSPFLFNLLLSPVVNGFVRILVLTLFDVVYEHRVKQYYTTRKIKL